MYFVGWGDCKIVCQWADVTGVTKEATMMGTIENAIRVCYCTGNTKGSYFFGSFVYRENCYRLLLKLMAIAQSMNQMNDGDGTGKANGKARGIATDGAMSRPPSPPVPPDETLKKMEVVVDKKLRNVSIGKFYTLVWSEGIHDVRKDE